MFCPHGRFVLTDVLSTDVLSPDVLSPDVLSGHQIYSSLFWLNFCAFCIYFTYEDSLSPLSVVVSPFAFLASYSPFYSFPF
jgi:hypothetical protein